MSRAETDLLVSIKKACSADETSPKRKHVRSCIVFTWDHKTSKPFWNGLKILPLQDDEVKLFKALITIHKVLQEGHPSVILDGVRNMDWIESLGRISHGDRGYSRLIREYDRYILDKLNFHRMHRGFNGTFEYEEYVSLRTVSDPNEGYQAIVDLISLQDAIDSLQKLILASISHSRNSECKISALVPLVTESYGIYKFITSMLRALIRSTGGDDIMNPLRESYNVQHARLYEFYADCSSIKYLTSLITIPKLPIDPPNLDIQDDGDEVRPPMSRSTTEVPTVEPTPEPIIPQPTAGVDFWNEQQQEQQRYQQEQLRIEQERQQQLAQQQQLQLQQQQYWLQQQQQQEEAQRQAQEQLAQDQLQRQAQGRAADLERDLLALRGQYERDQLMLEQYDQRVKALEQELLTTTQSAQQQIGSKDELISSLQEQLNVWKDKYESLAKLYSQLRQEHLNLLAKFKKVQQKAASAQEAIDKREKLEKEIKAKNIELADLIRERDRARMDLDRLKGGKNNEIERLETELRVLQDKLDTTERSQSSNLTSIFQNHNRELDELKKQLEAKSSLLLTASPDHVRALEDQLAAKDEELEIMQQTMDDAIKELAESQKENDTAMDEQIDQLLIDHLGKLTSFVDSILSSGIERIQDALYELDSPMQAGNQNSSLEFLLSIIEKASNSATDFATSFNNFIADGPNGDHSSIIKSSTDFASAISGVLLDTKGLTRLSKTDDELDELINTARWCAQLSEEFFENLLSKNLSKFPHEDDKTDVVIESNLNVQEKLQQLVELTEKLAPRTKITKNSGDLGDLVDKEMQNAAQAISAAMAHLTDLQSKPKDPTMSAFDLEINNAILSAAIAVTNAIQMLVQAATESQNDIVSKNKGANSRTAFYKKHNRWTEGLISALKLVAYSTNILITTADGVLSGKNSHEELIVASNEVAALTAQLVAASRVKAELGSLTQDKLERASRLVTSLCRSLVNQVQNILNNGVNGKEDIDFSKLSLHENKTVEMEQQVEILKLENALNSARKRLGEIRKFSYKDDDSDEE